MSETRRRQVHRPADLREEMGKLFEEAFTLPSLRRVTADGEQVVPLNMYETDVDLMIVAAMPGLQPEDIDVEVADHKVNIRAQMRGSLEETKNYLRHEWHYGPYSRTLDLPFAVDAARANAAYGGGVLTVALPKANVTKTHRIKLQRIAPARGEAAHHGAAEFAPQKHEHVSPRREGTPLKAKSRVIMPTTRETHGRPKEPLPAEREPEPEREHPA
ncbi:MAG: Hsp20/alpha crystallin family protein [Dehalococcoidales bacterium]|nr:Hsp20/alpha crystallin family protein [Dehalococcoidales bacterium]